MLTMNQMVNTNPSPTSKSFPKFFEFWYPRGKIHQLSFPNINVVITYRSHSGAIAAFYKGVFVGYFRNATFYPGRNSVPDHVDRMLDLFTQLEADPVEVLAKHGKEIGRCCVCNRPLTDDKSKQLGIGPICLKYFNR